MVWDLNWNNLTNDQREKLVDAADVWSCSCNGRPGQMALDMFNAVVAVIKERDRAEVQATLL